MRLFCTRGFTETTVQDIAAAADVSRGTFFNYYPYKEAVLLEHAAGHLEALRTELAEDEAQAPIATLYRIFNELGGFVQDNRTLVLPLSYELLNPDPERSRAAFRALPLTKVFRDLLVRGRAQGLVRDDVSPERLARTIANTYFLTALQWAAYHPDRPIREELRRALQISLEGMMA